ncbi:MAG: 30S ribosomal protein S14 [Candidatus Woesearchaeota archaeon]
MTTSDYRKAFTQLSAKPVKLAKYKKHNAPKTRTCSVLKRKCVRCGRTGGHISKYGLHLCRHCFREIATKIGFKQYA